MTYYLFIQKPGERPKLVTRFYQPNSFFLSDGHLIQLGFERFGSTWNSHEKIISKYKTIIIYRGLCLLQLFGA